MLEINNLNSESLTTDNQTESPSVDPARSQNLYIKFRPITLSSHLLKVIIDVDKSLTEMLYAETVELFGHGHFDGFDKSNVPADYVKETYKNEIYTKIKNYIFHHLVIDFLMSELGTRKINVANYPRLTAIEMLADKKINYSFDISIADQIDLKEWKLFAFSPPKRKKYKDLDKQVVSFIDGRTTQSKKNQANIVEEGDWVLFDAIIVDKQHTALNQQTVSSFWIRIDQQEVTEPFVHQLLGKSLSSVFLSSFLDLQQHDSKSDRHCYPFQITVKSIVKGAQFSLDMFRSMFRLKNKVDIHNKLMEVFSYRNDVSQRKAIIEEVFHLLLSKHRFEVPKHLVLRREEDILLILLKQPDYHVYKAQKDFQLYVEMLAEKQLKEEIIIDQIAYKENIRVDIKDIQYYLHFLCNKKLKEFIYFNPSLEKIDDIEGPIHTSTLSQAVMREKTLNHIIHILTK